MNVWQSKDWENFIDNQTVRNGLVLRFDKEVDTEVKRSCKEFAKWLRKQYYFPIRIPIYFKSAEKVRTRTGEFVSAKFFGPYSKIVEPYISIATGDVKEIEKNKGKDESLAAVLCSMIHELTHYFQWVNNIELTDTQAEKQAIHYKKKIIHEYALTREHP